MIYDLMTNFGKTKQEAEQMTQYDYSFMVVVKNLQNAKQKYLIDKNK